MAKVYLAGPTVFRVDAKERGVQMKKICANVGMTGLYPLDNEIDMEGLSKKEIGSKIFQANVKLIEACDAVVADITPFRGPSGDAGTVWEIGFARGLCKPVFAYSREPGPYLKRVIDMRIPHDGMLIEDFDLQDNLMIFYSCEVIEFNFVDALRAAKIHLENKGK